MTNGRKMELLNYYDNKLIELKDKGAKYRYEVRLQEAINEL